MKNKTITELLAQLPKHKHLDKHHRVEIYPEFTAIYSSNIPVVIIEVETNIVYIAQRWNMCANTAAVIAKCFNIAKETLEKKIETGEYRRF